MNGKFRHRVVRAFSLVEVVLALGVAAFGILSVFALLPVGMQSTRDSVDESDAVNLLSGVIADRMATPLTAPSVHYALPALMTLPTATAPSVPVGSPAPKSPATNPFWVTDTNQVSTTAGLSHYRVSYTFTAPPSGTLGPCTGYFKVSWPAVSANPTSYVEALVTFPQP